MLLRLNDVTIHYDSAEAVSGVSIEVEEGSVVGIIGSNGAGKSTLLRAISGLVAPTSGDIYFDERRINGLKPHDIVKMGIVQVPEDHRHFPHMSVLANLRMGAYLRRNRAEVEADLEDIFEHFPKLKMRRKQKAGTLSGGELEILVIARGLMAKPRLLLLDEPSLGLSPIIIDELSQVIRDINQRGVSVVLVEQNAGLVTEVTNRGYVIEVGKVVLEGDINELMADQSVQRAFIGG